MFTEYISLYCNEDNHDKVYHIQILPAGNNLYQVQSQYGKRTSDVLKNFFITKTPVSLWTAEREYHETIQKKKKKGYKVMETPEHYLAMIALMY